MENLRRFSDIGGLMEQQGLTSGQEDDLAAYGNDM